MATRPGKKPRRRRKPCKECEELYFQLRRGLCRSCYDDPTVRVRYGPASKHGRHQHDFNGGYVAGDSVSQSPPGSLERIAEMRARVEARVSTTHPGDYKPDLDSRQGMQMVLNEKGEQTYEPVQDETTVRAQHRVCLKERPLRVCKAPSQMVKAAHLG